MSAPITYQLASSAGYRADIARIGRTEYDHLSYYFKEDFPDVKITRRTASMDVERLEKFYLWTVNGYVYNTAVDVDNLYIPGCTSSMLRSRQNKIGMLNFAGVASDGLKKQVVDPDKITTDAGMLAYEKVFITFDEPVITPVFVMAGYLIFEHPEFFYRISDHTFAIRLSRLNYMEKLYEMRKYRDIFKDLGVPVSPNNPAQVNSSDIRSEQTIKKFLSLQNSFMVDLGCPHGIELNKLYLEHSTIPGNFRTHKPPVLPLFVGYGKLSEYHKSQINSERYSVYTQDSVYDNYLLTAKSFHRTNTYNDHRLPGATHRVSNAFFLDIRAKT